MTVEAFTGIAIELARWHDVGLQPRIWLRDDDATRPSAALDRLLARTEDAALPVLLAVIAKPCSPDLAVRLESAPHVRVAVHGFTHANNAAPDAKSTELTENASGRGVDAVVGELTFGKHKLGEIFGSRLTGILVPPWNRISPAVAVAVPATGFSALSLFAWRETMAPLPHLNTHVDFMDWRGGRVGHALETVATMLAARLGEARLRGGAPIGLLTHHLAHDETAWLTLEAILEYLAARDDITLTSAEACLRGRAQA